ncbi:MAG: discoidin domain-containing protein, partial [Prevotella sp.]|nr:discoidin domain-containing protein [Prevotella sp.]
MKRIKLLLAAVLSVMAWGGAQAQTDEQIDAANAAITNGGVYRIYTLFNGTSEGTTKYYLRTNGYLTADVNDAGGFTFTLAAGGTFAPGKGYKLNKFTNGGNGSGQLTDNALKQIIVGNQNRDDYEGQVFFLNEEGNYAIRSTNATGSNWGENAFWNVVEDNDADGLPNAAYVIPSEENPAPFIWKIEVDELTIAYNTVQSWPFKIQTAEGLVTNGEKWTSNAKDPSEGSYAALVDNDYATFFHSTYHTDNDPGVDHYLQAELSDAADKFLFYFKKRSQNNNNRPTTIVISASNDGENFTEIKTIANTEEETILPVDAESIYYISDEIDLGASYKYLRFTVPTTNTGAKNGEHVFFTFSEFYIYPATQAIKDALDIVKNTKSKADITDIDAVNTLDETLTAQAALKGNRRALNEAIAKAEAIENGTIPADAFTTMQADIIAYKNNSFTTAEEFSAAAEKLNGYIAMVDIYAAYKAVAADAALLALDITEQDAAVEQALTVEDINACIEAVKAKIEATQSFDITSYTIKNPEPYANADNWETSEAPTFDAGNKVAEFYKKSAATIKQTITLPAGAYRLTAFAHQRTGMTGTLQVDDKTTILVQVSSSITNGRAASNTWFNNGNGANTIIFALAEEKEVTIGITTDASTGDHWTVWRNFKLETYTESVAADYLKPAYAEILEASKATLADEAYKNVTGDEKQELADAIATVPENTVQSYSDVIEMLNQTTAAFTAAKVNYDLYVSEAIIARTISSELIVDTPTSAEEALEKFKELKVAEFEYVADAYPHSATAKIGEFTSWERTGTVNDAEKNEFEALTSQHWSGQARTYYEQPATGWSNNKWTANYTKTATLPAGNYIIKVAARAASGTATTAKIICSAATMDGPIPNLGDTGKGITVTGDASFDEGEFCNEGNGRGWVWNYLPFTLTEKIEVTMTIVAEANGTHQWFSVCDGELLSMDDIADKVNYKEDEVNTIEASELANVTIERNVVEGYNTVVLPFSLTAQQVQDAFGTGAEVYNFSENSENADQATVNFTKNVAGTIENNVPVLVKATAASEVQEFKGVEIVAPTEGAAVEGTNFNFRGEYVPAGLLAGDFFLSGNKLYKSTGLSSINGFRAYFENKTGVEDVKLFIDGIATRISDINDAAAQNGVLYNLAGQRVSKAQKGIFIQNGK